MLWSQSALAITTWLLPTWNMANTYNKTKTKTKNKPETYILVNGVEEGVLRKASVVIVE